MYPIINGAAILLGISSLGHAAIIPSGRVTAGEHALLHPRDSTPGLEYDPKTTTECTWWYDNTLDTNCNLLLTNEGISLASFRRWNPSINEGCTNLLINRSYCVEAAFETPPNVGTTTTTNNAATPTSTTVPNGIETPQPTQPGMVADCEAFYFTKPGDSCDAIAAQHRITTQQFLALNPSVGSTCSGLWANTYACVRSIGQTTTKPADAVTTLPANGIATPTPIQPGMVTNCNKFATIRPTTTCQGVLDWNKISLADFYKWNPGVKSDCTGMQANTYACIGVIGGTPPLPITTTTPPQDNGITTPTPIQPGMVTNCNKFATIRPTTTCQGVLDWNKITLADFFKWNPGVKRDCTGMQANTYACIGVIGGSSSPPTPAEPPSPPSNGVTTPTPIQAGMVTNCNKFATIRPTTTCQGVLDWNKITLGDFYKWNPGVKSDCTGMQANTFACIGVIGGTSGTPTQPNTGITTPSPIQAGMVKGCTKFHDIKTTTTCQAVLDYHKITLAQFAKWNPAVRSDCSNLWSGTYACVQGP